MNKLVYLGLSIFEMSKTGMFEFWYETKIWRKRKIMLHGYRQLFVKDLETKFNTLNYELERPLPGGNN